MMVIAAEFLLSTGEGTRLGARKLRDWRKRLGITQEEAAHILGITQNRVSMFERGKVAPNRKNALRIERLSKGEIPAVSWDARPLMPQLVPRKKADP